jgi:hypothetical protein
LLTFLKEGLGDLAVEAALLERNTTRENKFRLLRESEVHPRLKALTH